MLKKPIKEVKSQTETIWQPDEKILMFTRRHWFSLWPAYLSVILLVALISIFIFLFYFLGFNQFLNSFDLVIVPANIFWLVAFMLILTLVLFLYLSWMEYYLDVSIITNRRIIDIEQLNLFQRRIVSAELVSIQDVRSEVKGFFQSTLDFGTVVIETAGEAPNFILRDLPKPSNLVRDISAAASAALNPKKEPEKLIHHNEEDLKMHESDFAKEFEGAENETEYLAPDVAIEQKELAQEIKADETIKPLNQNSTHKKDKKSVIPKEVYPERSRGKESQPSSSLSFPSRVIPAKAGIQSRDKLRRESSKKIIHPVKFSRSETPKGRFNRVRHKDKGEIDF
jgi:hypothetical protein